MYTGVYFYHSGVRIGGIMDFGNYVNDLRIKSKKTLREFCLENGLDAGYWSKIERGVNPPPKDEEVLGQWAKFFGLQPKTEGWNRFMEEARASRGASPKDFLDDEKMAGLLPAFICTGDGNDTEELEARKLTQKIKEANTPDKFLIGG